MTKQAHFRITGLVQGVFYRTHARDKTSELGLCGRVGNLPDGSVEAILQGSKEALLAFRDWAKTGPPSAKVEKVEMEWTDSDEPMMGVEIY